MEADVIIVGGGPAGLAVAARLRGAQAVVLEASPRLGWPPHCTGIVSPATAERLLGRGLRGLEREGLLEAVYREAVFLGPGLREACRVEASPLAVKLRRPGIEEALAARAESRGHRVILGAEALTARQLPGGVEVAARLPGGAVARLRGAWAVLAQGRQRMQSLPLPPGPRCGRLIGLEERVTLTRRIGDEAFYTVHATRLAPGFFAWLAPLSGGREAVIGLAAPSGRGLAQRLQALRRLLSRRGLAEASTTLSRRGGAVLTGPPAAAPARGRLAWIGDTLCASKPYTGGGLYAVSLLAPRLAEALDRRGPRGLTGYRAAWRSVSRELWLQWLAAWAARRMGPRFLSLLARACSAAARGRCSIDYDRHSSLARCLLGGVTG